MAGTFGGYGLPLNGQLPAALVPGGFAFALDEANTAPPPGLGGGAAWALENAPAEEVTVEDGLVKAIGGRTWAGVEYGHAPGYAHSFFEYIDPLRRGDLEAFKAVEAATADWWFPTLDRGAGAALHFAADHGQLEAARFLLEERGAEVNQQDRHLGWTPLHRAARMAHARSEQYLEVFELLLQHGADPSVLTYEGWEDVRSGSLVGPPQSVFDVCTDAGLGWKPGRLRRYLKALVAKHAGVPKRRVFRYEGPSIGAAGLALMRQWAALSPSPEGPAAVFQAAPEEWVPPNGAGFVGAEGAQLVTARPWRPAGDADGSYFDRLMTKAELAQQEAAVEADCKALFAAGGEKVMEQARMH